MQEEEYISSRVDEQINWYDKKSISHKKVYKGWKITQIIISASIPFVVGYVENLSFLAVVVGLMGVVITCIEGVLTLGKYHENWIEYRSICETLRHEKYMYLTRTGVYKNKGSFTNLVERVESVISQENVNWAALNYEDNKKNGGN
ncbi:hypothetical protein NCCP2222_02280 [Sporosarcina sp. NCCP-2222]|uniref:DUF4231 domain-containing protein n=1 Tax=Sporosarcina sp. NCCP-2222 TaxID=2935073 RepID=UPI0020842668|nr:DUF4231 domain-containing protein [Sporosarcina sp. NCCP-2222]GKV54281.1 hypothetical protein NCCP2222_02280 [Sporosarcina sp. NCCP-2222]